MAILVRVDDAEVRAALAKLAAYGRPAVAKALNKVGFELRDAEAAEVARSFRFAGSSTRAFLASPRSFVFRGATPSSLAIEFQPKDRPGRLFIDHVFGATIRPDKRRLEIGGEIAVPVTIRRGARGRVPARQTPGALLAAQRMRRRKTVFVAGRALLRRVRGGGVEVLYALTRSFRLEKRFRYLETARDTVRRELPRKVRDVIDKFRR